MADYSPQLATASRMIKAKGMPVIFVRVEESTEYDPATDGYPTIETRYNVYGVRSTASFKEVQGYGFSAGSAVLYMAADVVKSVDTTDYVIFCGHKWDILNLQVIAPAETPIMFTLEIKDAGSV